MVFSSLEFLYLYLPISFLICFFNSCQVFSGQLGYFITMSANIVGGTTAQAINEGYEAQQGFIHGLVESALEIAVEKALGGLVPCLKAAQKVV